MKLALVGNRMSRGRRGFIRYVRRMASYIQRWGWDATVLVDVERFRHGQISDLDALDRNYREQILGMYREIEVVSELSRSI